MRPVRTFIFICFLTAVCGFSVSCGGADDGGYQYTVMYLNSDMTGLVEDEFVTSIASDETELLVDRLLKQMQSGSDDANNRSPISENVKILNHHLQNNQLAISFSAAYYERSGLEEILSRAAIVETLCQIQGVDYVEFFIEDQPFMIDNNTVGLMNREQFVTNLNNQGKAQNREVTLYFANESGDGLKAVTASITYNSVIPLAEILIGYLIHGEETIAGLNGQTGIRPSVPEDTVINSLTIRGQVCYVDLGSGFNNLLSGVSSEVSVYSIVNTLCELSNVNRVQFFIDGEPQDQYGEMDSFSSVLERDLDLVEEEKK